MRTTRLLALAATGLLAAATLSACGGGPDALDEAGAEEALLTQEEFPLDGWKRDSVEKGVQPDPTGFDASALPDVDEDCKKALETFSTLKPSEYLSSSVTGSYSKDDAGLQLQVAGVSKEAEKFIDVTRDLGGCGTVESDQGGVKVTSEFEEFESDDVRGVRIRSTVGEQKTETWIGGRTVGENLVYALGSGVSEDDLKKVVNAQVDKIED